jgi:hypothetical protein
MVTSGYDRLFVSVAILSQVNQTVSFVFRVSEGNLLSYGAAVAMAVASRTFPYYSVICSTSNIGDYVQAINNVVAGYPYPFSTGFNPKCLFGFQTYSYKTFYKIEYDTNNLPNSLFYNSVIDADGAGLNNFTVFCIV